MNTDPAELSDFQKHVAAGRKLATSIADILGSLLVTLFLSEASTKNFVVMSVIALSANAFGYFMFLNACGSQKLIDPSCSDEELLHFPEEVKA